VNRHRLAEAVRTRRHFLGYTQGDVAANGGPSTRSLRGIETARLTEFTPAMLAKLDRGLRWPRGTSASLLHGEADSGDSVAPSDAVCGPEIALLAHHPRRELDDAEAARIGRLLLALIEEITSPPAGGRR